MRILFVVPYPRGEAASQRFRFEHYLPFVKEQGITYRYLSFWSLATWNILYKPGYKGRKILGFMAGVAKRFFTLFALPFYQFVFIHREATPAGPAWFEWMAKNIFKKKIIYDFDDAIWIPVVSAANKSVSGLRNFGKVSKICRWSYKVSVGNDFLAQYAGKYNQKVVVLPTVVNTEEAHNRMQEQAILTPAIGWTGTFSTLPYLNIVLPVLQQLQEKYSFAFFVIADKDPKLPLKNYHFIKWSKKTEATDLLNFHIGIMPLHDDELSRGKCGFKAIQYMSLGIPAVVSPVGVNSVIVDNGINGFVCSTPGEWYQELELLLKEPSLREKMGIEARKKIQTHYSVTSSLPIFFSLFNDKTK